MSDERDELKAKIAQAYQVIGILLDEVGKFGAPEGGRAFDYFAHFDYDDDFLPWNTQ